VRHRTAVILTMALVLGACGDDASTEATTSAEPATTTVAVTTTTAATTTQATTTTAATTTQATTTTEALFTIDTSDWMPGVFGAPGDPNGSGCVVEGDVLPDGVWFGFAEAVSGGTITFDLGCFFTGAAADAAANADYGTDSGAEEGFHIRNQNPKVFSVVISPTAEAYYIDEAGPTWFPEPIALTSWPSTTSWLPCPGEDCAVWLYVNSGAATGIVEQYLP
jgi:hypothetical protein